MDLPLLPEHHQGLVLLYLAVAYSGDGAFDDSEQATAVVLLQRWVPGLDPEAARAVVSTAHLATRSGLAADVEALAGALRPVLSAERRRRVLSDLGQLAQADGHISVGEAHVIARVRAAWSGPA